MSSFGRSIFDSAGKSIQVTADGKPECKQGGITVDWALVGAQGSDVTWLDGVVVAAGEKGLRYGQIMCLVTASNLYAPYDPAAANGQQLLIVGKTFILNESMRQDEVASDHPVAIYGGLCFLNRILQSGVATHTLALGPTLAELLAVFPRLQPVTETA